MTTSLTDEYIGMLIDTAIEILFWGHSLPDPEVYVNILKRIDEKNLVDEPISDECKCLKRELHTEIVYGLIKLYNSGEVYIYAESIFWVLFAEALSRVDIVHCALILQSLWTGDVGWLLGGFLRLLVYNDYPSKLDDPSQLKNFLSLAVNINTKRSSVHNHHHNDSYSGSMSHSHTGTGTCNLETMDSILSALVNSLNSDLSTLSDNEKNIVDSINTELTNMASNNTHCK
tara:strand:+ start:2322 stop:3011 length:690 start_codon:yes stop_codon:yes gene_type:complete